MTGHAKERFEKFVQPVVDVLVELGVSADAVTYIGFLLSLCGAVCLGFGRLLPAFFLLAVGGVSDAFDGKVARDTGTASTWGSYLDSVLDRISETAIAAGMMIFFITTVPWGRLMVVPVLLGITGCLMVSYSRARAEGLGIRCTAGLMQRPERGILIGIGLLAGTEALAVAVVLMAVLTHVTVIQRFVYVKRRLNDGRIPVGSD